MKGLFILLLILFTNSLFAQDISQMDSIKKLDEVIIKAFAADRTVNEVPSAIAVLTYKELNRFNNTSLLPALNTIAGVQMEERSPGSYRLAIRGSSLRSPFGIRNVKVYWNFLPFTDGGGNTYLNSLDFSSINSLEIVKGPGASLYGAGTGGVLILNSELKKQVNVDLHFMAGSYGLKRYGTSVNFFSKKSSWNILLVNQTSDGYRVNTAMSRLLAQLNGNISIGKKSTLSTTLLFSDLAYQTPGGLTKSQYDSDPRQARPATATLPSAVANKAAVENKTIYAGLVHEIKWNSKWLTKTGIYGSINNFKNPTIRNYEQRVEYNTGGRLETHYRFENQLMKGKIVAGAELQYFNSVVDVFDNNAGLPSSTIQLIDTISAFSQLYFGQAEFDLPKQFYLTIGGSTNFLTYKFDRSAPEIISQTRNFNPNFSPRIALLKKLKSNISIYSSISYGFSPPSFAEIRPSTGNFNNTLNPEKGISFELGFRGTARKQFDYEITLYQFDLNETIVIQRTLDGAEFFINGGRTSQKGLEASLSWRPLLDNNELFNSIRFWSSYTLTNYRFKNYLTDSKDYSGNLLPGVAPNVLVVGFDMGIKKLYANITFNYVDNIPLNDANSESASNYSILGSRFGYKEIISTSFPIEFFAGIDNIFDIKYSLGNDLNAIGNRYYNVAPARNFYAGVKMSFRK